ncbi:MAG: serine/threonine-protein kinase [Gemmatimonadaceae bacterium]
MTAASLDLEFSAQLQRAVGADYRIERLLGEGGFGRVYAALDVRLGRSVAIKVIRPDLAGARAFIDRFRNEGTALAKFRHPGIVPIYDIREHEGLIYYVMPLIEGDTLRQKLDQRRALSPKETQRILIELCDCLAATHRAGILHRDVKPDNIMLEGILGSALLMDFGIAKSLEDYTATNSGVMVGTPTYMSPEQASGDTNLDNRSDIYSLGVLAYHMLTGRPPFIGRTAHQVIAAHVADKPEPIRKRNPSVPRSMADAVERCLEKNPDDRFQKATELSDALQNVTFGIEAERAAHEPRNYAMPFFAGLALACDIIATVGVPVVATLTTRDMWYLTGGFVLLAVMTSPLARAATVPLSRELVAKLGRISSRLKLSRQV